MTTPLGQPRGTVHEMQFDRDRLAEVATNSVTHADGHGTARIWRDEKAFVCEIGDADVITNPRADRTRMRTAGGAR
jgi:hypothetical protein